MAMAPTAPRPAPPRCWHGMLLVVLCVTAPVLSVPADMASTTATPATAAASKSPQDIPSFFPKIKNDLTKVTWAHAVNSKDLLAQALNGSVMMLEADVLMGTTDENPTTVVPIMGHPPANHSDLSLRDFLHAVVTHNTDHKDDMRGVKLDFKTIEVFEKALDYMKETFDQPQFPVWLNADIMPGPVNSTTLPVDANRFLVKAKEQFPELTLSLGWTTRWGKGLDGEDVPAAEAMYSEKNIQDMIAAINNNKVTEPITYAVRAAFVAHSLDKLKTLLKETAKISAKPTLTVWSSDDTDVIDVKMLRKNILEIGKTNVYVDVGEKLSKQLDLASSAIATYSSVLTTAVALVLALVRV